MTLKNNGTPLICYRYFKLCALFRSHWSIQTGVTVRESQIRVKSAIFLPVWPWNLMDDLENNRAPLLCYFKLYASFNNHQSIQTGVTVRKRQIWSKSEIYVPSDLEIWLMTLKNNRASLLCHIKLCASFHRHMWILTGVREWLHWVLTSMTLTFDFWPWPFCMIRWWEHSEKGVTDRRTYWTIHWAWSQLKGGTMELFPIICQSGPCPCGHGNSAATGMIHQIKFIGIVLDCRCTT